jgi:hypothetical protein
MSNGTFALPPTFAGAFAGGGGARSLATCARARWAPASQAKTEAMVMSLCEYNWIKTKQGNVIYDAPGFQAAGFAPKEFAYYPRFSYPQAESPPNTNTRTKLAPALTTNANASCGTNSTTTNTTPAQYNLLSGWDFVMPTNDGLCRADTAIGDWLVARSDNPDDSPSSKNTPSHYCKSHLNKPNNVLFIPLYDQVKLVGGVYQYHIVGLAGWVSTGYFGFEKWVVASSITGQNYCGPDIGGDNHDQCMYGYFSFAVTHSAYAQDNAAGTNYGGFAVKIDG